MGYIKIQGTRGVMLDPLAEVIIGMFMPVCIRYSQFMMDILRDSKGGES